MKVQYFNIISCKPVYVQRKGKYASKGENTGGKENILEEKKANNWEFRESRKITSNLRAF